MAVGISTGELRELNEEDLTTKLRQAKEELFNLRFQSATGQLPRTHAGRRTCRGQLPPRTVGSTPSHSPTGALPTG